MGENGAQVLEHGGDLVPVGLVVVGGGQSDHSVDIDDRPLAAAGRRSSVVVDEGRHRVSPGATARRVDRLPGVDAHPPHRSARSGPADPLRPGGRERPGSTPALDGRSEAGSARRAANSPTGASWSSKDSAVDEVVDAGLAQHADQVWIPRPEPGQDDQQTAGAVGSEVAQQGADPSGHGPVDRPGDPHDEVSVRVAVDRHRRPSGRGREAGELGVVVGAPAITRPRAREAAHRRAGRGTSRRTPALRRSRDGTIRRCPMTWSSRR